jgi:cell wall assembly regulator SMI1
MSLGSMPSSIVGCLGLHDVEGALLTEARAAWRDWADRRLVDGVVDDLASLPEWTLSSPAGANHVLGALAAFTESEPEAVTAFAWVPLPGAEAVARKLADLRPDINGMVAGQLWIEATDAHRIRSSRVAR